VSVAKARVGHPRELRVLPLEGFAPVGMGVLWRGEESELMRAVSKGVVHRNTGSRKVSRLAAQLRKMSAA